MHQDVTVSVEGVAKKFVKGVHRSMVYGMQDIARDLFALSNHSGQLRKDEFWAVHNVSFELKRGDALGIIGPNGAGKSTLLKLMNGIIKPDKGLIRVKGVVGALIEVGSGFHPALTGRENIFVNGTILGMSHTEIKRKFESIVEFAEVGDFVDVPVKHYSSGMYVRLGFAVAAHCEPDILLVDEVLAVGDLRFRKKCFDFFEKQVLGKGITLVLISHDAYAVSRMCAKCLVLHEGQPWYLGDAERAVVEYYHLMREMSRAETGALAGWARAGIGEVRLQSISIVDSDDVEVQGSRAGDKVKIRLLLKAERDFEELPTIWFRFIDMSNNIIAHVEMPPADCRRLALKVGENELWCSLPSLNLAPGTYSVRFQIGGLGLQALQDSVVHAATIEVLGDEGILDTTRGQGLVYLPNQWSLAVA